MIKSFTIKNYKSYGNEGVTFDFKRSSTFRPVNLFYGSNGSGKSSIKSFIKEQSDKEISARTNNIVWVTDEKLLCFDEQFVKERFEKQKGTLSITTGKSDADEKRQAEEAIIQYETFKNTLVLRNVTSQVKVFNGGALFYTDAFNDKINGCSQYKDFFLLEKESFKELKNNGLSEVTKASLKNFYNDFKNRIDRDNAVSTIAGNFLKQLCEVNVNIIDNFVELLTCSWPCYYLYFSLTSQLDEVRDNGLDPKNYRDNNVFFENIDENKINNVFNHIISKITKKIDDIIVRLKLLKDIKNPQYVADKINNYLAMYGFFDIKLEVNIEGGIINQKKNMYNLIVTRTFCDNTKDMFTTLSEGEKHLLAFLYFYELCLGFDDYNEALNPKNKIILIDDPITSMDSNSIFLVSNLICDLLELDGHTRGDVYTFKHQFISQGMVLTHNAFFLRELFYRINFAPKKMSLHYIYKKCIEQDGMRRYISDAIGKDFIKDDYTILWDTFFELTDPTKNVAQDGITPLPNIILPNICRRILESYGKFEGLGKNDSATDIINNLQQQPNTDFSNDELRVYNSFVAMFNTGSHYIAPTDDLNMSNMGVDYYKIFETLFSILDPQHWRLRQALYNNSPR